MKKLMMTCAASAALFLAPGGFATAYADAPAAPNLTIQAYVNGALNLGVWMYSSAYPSMSGTVLSGLSYDVQMKGPGDADFADVAGTFATFNYNKANFTCWSLATNYVGSATLRIRAKNGAGETSDWVESKALMATVAAQGTYIGSCDSTKGLNAFDGKISTLVDDSSNGANTRWTGYLFATPTRIKGIRYLARLDSGVNAFIGNRFRGGVFQIASDETFSDAVTVHTIPNTYSDITQMTEVLFDAPVTCTAIRHYKDTNSYEQSAEVEYIPADPPYSVTMTTTSSDLTNFYPVVTWTMPEGVWSDCALEVATQEAGPFTAVEGTSHVPADGATFVYTNTAAKVGVTLYYRVTATCCHPAFDEGSTFSSTVQSITRARRLDRAWGDEKTLLGGVTVLPDTNGVMQAELKDHTRCFDGNTSTFVDQYSGIRPVIGLKFASPAHVVGFGYICRNDNSCHFRIRNAQLYAANDTPALLDRVVVAGNPTQSSQTTAFYYKACDTVLGTGASCYFLYDDGEFYGNVAEVMFFGWTDADTEAAGIVLAPAALTFARDGSGLALTWSRGFSATGYRVERRVRGTDAWTTIGTTEADVLTLTDTAVATAVYEYRVVTLGADGAEATSETFTYRFYVPGSGTGLSGVVMWPYDSKSSAPTQRANEVARGPEAINLTWAADAPLAEGVTDAVAHLAWEGKIIVPFTGDYTFTLETDAGGAVFIDHATVCNSWTGGTKTPSGSVSFSTEGEHVIRVDYRSNENGSARKCVLRWKGPVEDEIVPLTQLLPAETAPTAKVDDFTVQVYGQTLASHVARNAANDYTIMGAAKQTLGTLADGLNLTALLRPWTGSLDCQMNTRRDEYGSVGVLLQNADGTYLTVWGQTSDTWSWYGVTAYDPETKGSTNLVAKTLISKEDPGIRHALRLTREGPLFTFYWKRVSDETWQEIGSWTDTARMFDRDIYVGPTVWGATDRANPVTYEVTDFAIKALSGPMVIILR